MPKKGDLMTLDKLEVGKTAVIKDVGGEGALRLRFLDMGLIPKTKVMVYKIAPLGDPIELHLRSYSLSIRKEDAAMIEVEPEGSEDNVVCTGR
jgi:Fe2+ transport system protein FeoA